MNRPANDRHWERQNVFNLRRDKNEKLFDSRGGRGGGGWRWKDLGKWNMQAESRYFVKSGIKMNQSDNGIRSLNYYNNYVVSS